MNVVDHPTDALVGRTDSAAEAVVRNVRSAGTIGNTVHKLESAHRHVIMLHFQAVLLSSLRTLRETREPAGSESDDPCWC